MTKVKLIKKKNMLKKVIKKIKKIIKKNKLKKIS